MLLLGCILALSLSPLTESATISLQSTDNITIHIKPGLNKVLPPCYICTPQCKESRLEVSRGKKVDYTFSCPNPEMHFIMEINRTIDCSSGICPMNISLQPTNLNGLNRTFIWDILTSKNDGLVLGFSTPWLRQIHPSSLCSDLVSFKIGTYVRESSYGIGTFCRNGTITRIKVQGRGVVALTIPWNVNINNPGISITNRSTIRSLSIVESTFRQESFINLLSANYPDPFPNSEQMIWKFNLPDKHAATVQFLNFTSPTCVKNENNVIYHPNYQPKPTLLKLADKQPANILGNFNLTLQNCDVNKQMIGLSLNFSITVQKTQGNIIYPLDLTNEKGLVVRISKRFFGRTFTPVCVICKAATDCEPELVIEGGKYYRISFLCENLNSLVVTAEKQIEECIFTVSPKTSDAIYLQTPHWEFGLPDYVSVSWKINLPTKRSGRLKFGKDKMDISCEMSHANIYIKPQKGSGPDIVRREDEQLPGSLDMYSGFWVNITNCKTLKASKKLKLQLYITFDEISQVLKIILIAVSSAVGVVLAVIVTICCLKKKKKQIKSPVGIYNSRVNTEAPRRQAIFKKGRKTNESHIYAVIDDNMVYGHLLQETNGTDPEVDVYRPFEGPMGDAPPVPPLNFPNRSTKQDVTDGSVNGDINDDPLALSMKDNEIYIFSKSISRQPVENEDTSLSYMDDSRSGTIPSL
ncbi:hypothetical protein GDO81_012120 [Engystomops pustulosus]|uniref:CUB domain-containing protein 1 n=1 Tax=Engystomops pustulosus TaxID=76066 RepID=A0AAV7BJ34_ENGPU|nr:hypothetical protein GDO81_012120 [Engystomops pustulosus]